MDKHTFAVEAMRACLPQSLDEFEAIHEALDQFVANSDDALDAFEREDDPERVKIAAALAAGRAVLDRITAVFCRLADEPAAKGA